MVDGRKVAVGNLRLMEREDVDLGGMSGRAQEMASNGQTSILAAIDGRAVAVCRSGSGAKDLEILVLRHQLKGH
jgi:P-type Cu2+ transporter